MHKLMFSALALLLLSGPIAGAQIADAPEAKEMRFSGGFKPRFAVYGGFGGGSACRQHRNPNRVPVVFIHGNGDFAGNWNARDSRGGPSVLDHFRKAGYTECDLFGVTYLSAEERRTAQLNFHSWEKGKIVASFINDVFAYTHASQVDIVTHSLGVTMTLFALDEAQMWKHVRTFVSIAGAMRGLSSCAWGNPASTMTKTCNAQSLAGEPKFGFWPDGYKGFRNYRLGESREGLGQAPFRAPRTEFYSIRAGRNDEIVCGLENPKVSCEKSSVFAPGKNVPAQIDIGRGEPAPDVLHAKRDVLNTGGDVGNGIGHLRAKTDSGRLQLNMIVGRCQGLHCCRGFSGQCRK